MVPVNDNGRINRYLIAFAFFISVSPYLIQAFHYPYSPARDWSYFNALALVITESIKSGHLPLLDAWGCGGIDLFSNPQNWIFSPLLIFNLLFPPYLGNLLTILACAAFGFYGMMKFTATFVQDKKSQLLLSVLFNLSPFFFLHFIEGHLTYRTFYLLPLVLYLASTLNELKKALFLTVILAWMFIDGGIYPFYFSLFLILLNLNYPFFKETLSKKEDLKTWGLMALAFICLIGSKALPVLSVHANRIPEYEISTYSLNNIITALFNIKQSNYNIMPGLPYFAHEYSHYLGPSLLVLICFALFQFKKIKWPLFQLLLFIWIAFGIGGEYNPWTLIKMIPLVNHLHVQSRFLIAAYLMILWIVGKTTMNTKIKNLFLATAVVEMLICGFFINQAGFKEQFNSHGWKLKPVTNTSLYADYIPKQFLYSEGKLSYKCYEPAKNEIVKSLNLFIGTDVTHLKADFDFNQITIHSNEIIKDKFILNFAWNGGWDCDNCNAYENNGVIEVAPLKEVNKMILTYNPYHYQFTFFLYFVGLFLIFISYRRIKNEF